MSELRRRSRGGRSRPPCLRTAALFAALLGLAARAAAQAPPPARSFAVGFTNFPYDASAAAQAATYDFIADEADLVVFHLDHGVPWPEAFAGAGAWPSSVVDALADAKDAITRRLPGHLVYISTTPQSQMRNGELAPYWGTDTQLPLPAPWDARALDDPAVVQAFTNWCRYLISELSPDYFAYAIESNGGFASSSDPDLLAFLSLASQVYATLRAENPGLPIFLTLQTGSLQSSRAELLALSAAMLAHSDYLAISSYPYAVLESTGIVTYGNPAETPDFLLDDLLALDPAKPVAISETGYIAEDLDIPALALQQRGTRAWQASYVHRLFEKLRGLDTRFVVWFVSRDYDAMETTLAALGNPLPPASLIWRDTGLADGAGVARPALTVWRSWLAGDAVPVPGPPAAAALLALPALAAAAALRGRRSGARPPLERAPRPGRPRAGGDRHSG